MILAVAALMRTRLWSIWQKSQFAYFLRACFLAAQQKVLWSSTNEPATSPLTSPLGFAFHVESTNISSLIPIGLGYYVS